MNRQPTAMVAVIVNSNDVKTVYAPEGGFPKEILEELGEPALTEDDASQIQTQTKSLSLILPVILPDRLWVNRGVKRPFPFPTLHRKQLYLFNEKNDPEVRPGLPPGPMMPRIGVGQPCLMPGTPLEKPGTHGETSAPPG